MPKRKGLSKKAEAAIAIAVILGALVVTYLAFFFVPGGLGTQLIGDITVVYSDGTSQTFHTDTNLWGKLQQSVLSNLQTGQRINSIKADVSIRYTVTGLSSKVTTQYWVIFYMQVTGPAGVGIRYRDVPLFGTGQIAWLRDDGTRTFDTDRWVFLTNGLGFAGNIANYYMEKGSGLQVGNINLGPAFATAVYKTIGQGTGVGQDLANQLTLLLGTVDRTNGQTEALMSWQKDGATFFKDLYTIAYPYQIWGVPMPSGQLVIPGTSISFGAGEYMRMNNGDGYSISFRVAAFYRWQDSTGIWTPWNEKNIELARINTSIKDGWYTFLSISVSGPVTLG